MTSTVATIGFFDGVHRGHQCLIRQVQDEARRRGLSSLVITFDRHPRSVFAPESVPPLLTSAEEKMTLLRQTGVDDIYVLPFDREMAALTAREFMQQVLRGRLGVEVLVIGYDHRFGRPLPCGESFADYQAYGRELGIDVVLAQELEGEHVSSSLIRQVLVQGDVTAAAYLLGRPYTWTGRVIHGRAVGHRLGFPTANLQTLVPNKLLPANGVYAVAATSLTGDLQGTAGAMLNIGQRPTIDNGSDVSIEAHLFDFHGDLYEQTLTLFFVAHLRAERRFDSEQALIAQLLQDEQKARFFLCALPSGSISSSSS